MVSAKSIIEFLESGRRRRPEEIMREFGITRRQLVEKLRRIERALKKKGKRLRWIPAKCRDCGFEFSRKEIKIPTKCPRCGSEWIEDPIFWVE